MNWLKLLPVLFLSLFLTSFSLHAQNSSGNTQLHIYDINVDSLMVWLSEGEVATLDSVLRKKGFTYNKDSFPPGHWRNESIGIWGRNRDIIRILSNDSVQDNDSLRYSAIEYTFSNPGFIMPYPFSDESLGKAGYKVTDNLIGDTFVRTNYENEKYKLEVNSDSTPMSSVNIKLTRKVSH